MANECKICENELCLSWTDTHGVAQCRFCGHPYRVFHYENDKRVDKPATLLVKDEYIPVMRAYWGEFHRIVPAGCSFPGGYELATRDDAEQFNEWMKENCDKILHQQLENQT